MIKKKYCMSRGKYEIYRCIDESCHRITTATWLWPSLLAACCSDDYLVRVKAQVMVRDDSTGGWVPLGRGGMSLVGLRRQVLAASLSSELHHEYLIYGRRISDKSVSTRHAAGRRCQLGLTRDRLRSFNFVRFHSILCDFVRFRSILYDLVPFRSILFRSILFHFVPFRFIMFHYVTSGSVPFGSVPPGSVPFRSISFHFVPFRSISFHFVPFRSISFHFVPFRSISFHFVPFRSISFHFVPFRSISFHFVPFRSRPAMS